MGCVMDKKLLSYLVCPQTGAALQWQESQSELWSVASGLAYPVRDGIPVMLVEEARLLTNEELRHMREGRL